MSQFYKAANQQRFSTISNPEFGHENFKYDYNRSIEFAQAVIYANSYDHHMRAFETKNLDIPYYSDYSEVVANKGFDMFIGGLEFPSALSNFQLCFRHLSYKNNANIVQNKNSTIHFLPLDLRFKNPLFDQNVQLRPSYNSKSLAQFYVNISEPTDTVPYTIADVNIRLREFYLDFKDRNVIYKIMCTKDYRESYSPLADSYVKSIAFNKNKNILENCPKGMELAFSLQVDLDRLVIIAKGMMQEGKIAAVGDFFYATTKNLNNNVQSKEEYMFAKSICILYNVLFSNDLKVV